MIKAPKLRFKEFSGDWESENTLNMLKERKGSIKIGPFGSALKKEFYVDNGIKVYAQENVFKNNFELGDYYITDEKYETLKSCELVPGDLVISMMGTIGSCAIFPQSAKKGIMNSHLLRLQFKDKYSTELIAQLLKESPLIKKQIKRLSVGSIMEGLSSSVVQQLIFTLPDIKEQEKIASFLSLIDDKISLQGEKVEALKDYKKGMMQKIFSRELRFKDDEGRDYPEWEVTTIEKVADLEKGFTPDTKNEKNWIGDTPWLSIADMKQGKYISYVSKHISDEALGNKKLVPKGTLIMSFKLTLGRLGIVNREMMTNEAICHFYWKNKNINTEYMYYYLSTVNIESFGCRAAKGITLNNDSLNSIVVKLPVIDEQNKIADILMKIDNKIYKEQEKLDSLNEYKKGLLQQMFI